MQKETPRTPEEQRAIRHGELLAMEMALVNGYNATLRRLRDGLARELTKLGTEMGDAGVDLQRAAIELAPLDRAIFDDADWHFRRAYSNARDAGDDEKGRASKGSWWSDSGPHSGGN